MLINTRFFYSVPWQVKIFLKLVLSVFPFNYSFWRFFGLFRHGQMDNSYYPLKIFSHHIKRAYIDSSIKNFSVLELGPGDSIASAIIGFSFGVSNTYLVDSGFFATQDLRYYKNLVNFLSCKGFATPDLTDTHSFDELLTACNCEYLTNGLKSLRTIPDKSVDFIWSHSVLEHIYKEQLLNIHDELFRVLKSGGRSSHNIDYQDHLNYSLNSYRFPSYIWESQLFRQSGFYTNRVPAVEMHKQILNTGFTLLSQSFGRWPELPILRSDLDKEFQRYSDQELIIRTSHISLIKI